MSALAGCAASKGPDDRLSPHPLDDSRHDLLPRRSEVCAGKRQPNVLSGHELHHRHHRDDTAYSALPAAERWTMVIEGSELGQLRCWYFYRRRRTLRAACLPHRLENQHPVGDWQHRERASAGWHRASFLPRARLRPQSYWRGFVFGGSRACDAEVRLENCD